MKISRSFTLYMVMVCLTLLGAASAWSQTNFSIKIYAEDATGWKDSVIIGRYTSATDAIGDSISPTLVENELPPVPPSGPDQAPDLRITDPLGGLAYGQGVGVDLRNLVSDGQSNTYRIRFRRTDPDGIPVTLSWAAGLSGTFPNAGFFMTDGFGGFLFPTVDMTAQTSFTDASFDLSLSGSFVDIIIGDGTMMRTFTADSIAMASDLKGKVGKYEKAKPISVDFITDSISVPVGGADQFYIEFDKLVEGWVTFPGDTNGHVPISISGLKKYTVNIPDDDLYEGQKVIVYGNGAKGKIMKGKHGFSLALSKIVKVVTTYSSQILRLPMPNVNNIGDEMYLQPLNLSIGMGPGIGLAASIGLNAKGKPIIHHISYPKWKDVTKTMYKFKNVVILQNDTAYCLDTIKSKENIKMLKSLGPDKTVRYKDSPDMGNKLIGQLTALKFNMAASALGHTPAGTEFRDLTYVGPETAWVGKTVDSIAIYADHALACYSAGPVPLPAGWTYIRLADFLETLNEEFSGAWDTASWSGTNTVATGIKPLALSTIFAGGGASAAPRVTPGDYSTLYEVPAVFSLSQNYPNPFNPTTTIEFSIPEDAIVTLRVYNMLGQVVATLADREEFSSGENWVEFDAAKMSTGVYYYQINVNDGQYQSVQKMVLMK